MDFHSFCLFIGGKDEFACVFGAHYVVVYIKKCFCLVKLLAFFLSMVIKKFVSKLVWSEGHTCL